MRVLQLSELHRNFKRCTGMASTPQSPSRSLSQSIAGPRRREPRNKPSNVTKERINSLIQQQVNESGKIARQLCQQSGSRDVSPHPVTMRQFYYWELSCNRYYWNRLRRWLIKKQQWKIHCRWVCKPLRLVKLYLHTACISVKHNVLRNQKGLRTRLHNLSL